MPKFKQVTFELSKFIPEPRLRRIKKKGEEFLIPEFQYDFFCFIPLSLASKKIRE